MTQLQWLTPKQIAKEENYPFSLGQIRSFLCYRHINGLKTAVRKIGKCLYLRKDLFDAWIDSNAEK